MVAVADGAWVVGQWWFDHDFWVIFGKWPAREEGEYQVSYVLMSRGDSCHCVSYYVRSEKIVKHFSVFC